MTAWMANQVSHSEKMKGNLARLLLLEIQACMEGERFS